MKALILAVVFAAAASWAGPPTAADAPVKVRAGEIVPFDGVLDSSPGYEDLKRREARGSAEAASYKANPPLPVVIAVTVVTAVVAAAAGAGVTYLVTRPAPP